MSIPCSFFCFSFFIFNSMYLLLFDAKSFLSTCPPMTTLPPGVVNAGSIQRIRSSRWSLWFLSKGCTLSRCNVFLCFCLQSPLATQLLASNNPANVGFAWWWQFGTVLQSRLEIGPRSLRSRGLEKKRQKSSSFMLWLFESILSFT